MFASIGRSKIRFNLRGAHRTERRPVEDQGEETGNPERQVSEEGSFDPQSATKSALEIDGRDEIRSLAFLMDGKHILSGGKEEKIRRWQLEDGVEFGKPMVADDWANNIAVSSDEKWIIGGAGWGHLSIWNVRSHDRVGKFKGHTDAIVAVDISADGTKIASGSDDKTACIWERATGERLLTLQHDGKLVAVKFSPDGSLLATATWGGHRSVRVYRSEDGHLLAEFPIRAGSNLNQSFAWGDERYLYVISQDGHIHFLHISTPKTVSQWPIRTDRARKHGCIALSPNRRFIAVSAESSMSVWDMAAHSKIGSDVDYNDRVKAMVVSENYDIAIGHGKTIIIRNLHGILPPHYFNVDTRESTTSPPIQGMRSDEKITSPKKAVLELKSKLEVLQGQYKAQSRELVSAQREILTSNEAKDRQIDMLTAEVDCWKRFDAEKAVELAVACKELEECRRDSEELIIVREELQSCQSQTTAAQEWYNDQSQHLRSVVEESQHELAELRDQYEAQSHELTSVQDKLQASADSLRRYGDRVEKLGDTAMDSQRYNDASELFSTVLSFNPVNRLEILVKRSKVQVYGGLWENALRDADEIIKLDPSSHWGYEQRHAALHAGGRYSDAFDAFHEMVTKFKESSDLSSQYIDVTPVIQKAIDDTVSDMPNVLIDSTTGHLYSKAQQKAAFQKLPIYDELRSSMTTRSSLNHTRIQREVEKFYRYVMLSHRWEDGEPLYQTVQDISIYELEPSSPNAKLKEFSKVAHALGFHWVWSDTCCIDKKDMVVLHASLVAMFRWYHDSALTIVHLHGVQSLFQKGGDLGNSEWSKRGWTYQEYVAAKTVQFYTEDWKPYLGLDIFNHKMSPIVIAEIAQASQVSAEEQRALQPGPHRVREKLFLASQRLTTVAEDAAYSLLGIFDANIFIKYGEGKCKAVGRLLEYVLTSSRDVTILAWTGHAGEYNSCLPADLTVYDRLSPLQIPHAIEPVKMDEIIQELHSSLPQSDISSIARLFSELNKLPPPSISSGHLQLSGLAFPITIRDELKSDNDFRIYRRTTMALGEVEITTKDNLPKMKRPLLFHPWISTLLDQDFSGDDDDDDLEDETHQALRLVARLRQPFGALLLTQASRTQHRRVATDSLILVRIREDVPWVDLMETIMAVDLQ